MDGVLAGGFCFVYDFGMFKNGPKNEPKNEIVIYTDGSSMGNPGPGGWGAILFMHGKVREMGGGEKRTTNNRMELIGAIQALRETIEEDSPVTLYTDSKYVIKGITEWIHSWQRRGWMTATKEEVLNQDLWKELLRASEGRNISWKHVYGHSGHALNERVDKIAQTFALGAKPDLFLGLEEKYTHDLSAPSSAPSGEKRGKSGKAYSYVSALEGRVLMHKTWDDCERRVKGKKGAKFRKVFSQDEEGELIKLWRK